MNLTKEFSGKEENVLAVNSKSMFIVQYNILNKTKKKKQMFILIFYSNFVKKLLIIVNQNLCTIFSTSKHFRNVSINCNGFKICMCKNKELLCLFLMKEVIYVLAARNSCSR